MAELCLMASHGGAPDLGIVFPFEHGLNRVSKDNRFLSFYGSNQDFVNSLSINSSSLQRDEWQPASGLLDCNNLFKIDTTFKRPPFIDIQGTHQELKILSLGIAEQCVKHERILNILATGSTGIDSCLNDLSMLYHLMWPPRLIADFLRFISDSRWCFNDAELQQSLIYPNREIYFNEPLVELIGDYCSCTENMSHFDSQLQFNCSKAAMNGIFSALHSSKNTNKSHKQTMLVPYFERRKRVRSSTNASKLVTEKAGPIKSHDKVKEKTYQKSKILTRAGKDRDISHLHACEILLSILVDKKQQSKNTIYSLKKSSPQLPHLLNQFSASIAGVGIAVVLSVISRVTFSRVPFCASRILSTGLGFVLISLSWAVHRLRNTVVSIGKISAKNGEKENEMMNHLETNMKDVYFRLAALIAVAVLRLV